MKRFKKLASLLLALVMVCAMSVTAFAATSSDATSGSITINSAVEGETYSIYQLATVTYNTETDAYTYKPTTEWSTFLASATNYVTIDSQGYLTWTGATTAEAYAAFAQLAQAYAEENNIEATATADCAEGETSVEFSNLSLGWYLVDTSLGALCGLTTTAPDATVSEKNGTPSVDKVIVEDDDSKVNSNTASIGDVIDYQTTITGIAGASSLKLYDTLGTGLTLNASSITVTYYSSSTATGTVLTADTDYTVDTTAQSFTIDFAKYASTLTSADSTAYIVVTYSATVNSSAEIGTSKGNTNETYVTYGDGESKSEKDTTTTYVYSFSINKTDKDSSSLSGAEFTLSSGTTILKFTADGTTYTLDNTSGNVTITAGNVTISGLGAGTYTLKETKAPDGYNLLTYDITVVIAEDGTVTFYNTSTNVELTADSSNASLLNVINVAGSELPSTGGIGTTIFYVVGTIMVLGAVVVLITRKRMSAE